MIASDPAFLATLADCLEAGDTLSVALDKVASAGGAAQDWTQRVRRSMRPDGRVATALRESDVVDDDELSILSVADDTPGPAVRAVVLRRQRSLARTRALGWGLAGPFAFAALTVVLAPLPEIIGTGPYLWPVLRGLIMLTLLTLAIFAGTPALLGARRAREVILGLCTRLPGLRALAALYAEEELTTVLAPLAERGDLGTTGLAAVASLLEWSPLGEKLRAMARSSHPSPGTLPMGGLDPLARQLSPATDLAIVGGVASKRLSERLTLRGDAIAQRLTARLRLATRAVAYTLVVVFSASSLVSLIERGLPGMPQFPGGVTSPDQKELEDLLKELEK